MRFVNEKIHGVIDYVAAIALIGVPLIADFQAVSPVAHWFSIAAGAALFLYSLVTTYSYSVTGLISFRLHLTIDFIAGVAFIAAPFVFSFGGTPRIFYLAAGAAVVVLVLLTDPTVEEADEGTTGESKEAPVLESPGTETARTPEVTDEPETTETRTDTEEPEEKAATGGTT